MRATTEIKVVDGVFPIGSVGGGNDDLVGGFDNGVVVVLVTEQAQVLLVWLWATGLVGV